MERDHNLHENVSHWPLNLCSFLKRISLSLPSGIYLDPSCPEEGHAAALLPSWPARGQQEQLYKSWLYKKKKKISGRSSSWALTPPSQPQPANYRGGAYMIPAFPRGHQTVGRGSVKLAALQIWFCSFVPVCWFNPPKTAGRLLGSLWALLLVLIIKMF